MFSEVELAVLGDFASIARARQPESLGDVMTLVAMLGGYLNSLHSKPRSGHDRPPGHQIQWDGQIRLAQQAQLVEYMQALGRKSGVLKLMSPVKM